MMPRSIQKSKPGADPFRENLPEGFEQRDIIRHIHSRVLLNYETARAVLEWLEDRVATLEMEDGEAPLFSGHSGREQ